MPNDFRSLLSRILNPASLKDDLPYPLPEVFDCFGVRYLDFKGELEKKPFAVLAATALLYFALLLYVLAVCVESELIFGLISILGFFWMLLPLTSASVRRLRNSGQSRMWTFLLVLSLVYLYASLLIFPEPNLLSAIMLTAVLAASLFFHLQPARPKESEQ